VWGVRFNVHKIHAFILAVGVLSGCATLPDVDPWLRFGGAAPSDTSAIADLSRQEQTDAVLAKLTRKSATVMSWPSGPLEEAGRRHGFDPGHDATLLIDGPATYTAMFKAIASASDHVHLESIPSRTMKPVAASRSC